jgi:hypothetical protein
VVLVPVLSLEVVVEWVHFIKQQELEIILEAPEEILFLAAALMPHKMVAQVM